ncbi:thiaminase II [uncultured Anaerococcus sp.]|uniref:thiaminase II n=1 Tax=uncultured Anaerococcus sp. TaxID=293428 RepID=UPI00288A923B|nr:thiaminase II [uncultured Anaerococcus sp.]
MKFIDYLYEQTKDIWQDLYNHPFIEGLISGDLEISRFKYYLEEDYIYLWDHVKIFAIGLTKTNNKDIIRKFAYLINNCMENEMAIHRGVMKDFDIDIREIENRQANLTNLSYSNYRISQSQLGGYEEILMVLMACDLGYVNIFSHIDDVNPQAKNHEIYGKFITGYLDPVYLSYVDGTVDEINELGKDMTKEKKDALIKIFKNCLTYELKFWDMVYNKGDLF